MDSTTANPDEHQPPDERSDRGLLDRAWAPDLWDASRPRFADRVRWWVLGQHKEPPQSFVGVLEDPDDPERIGICCSGGGIRSASFNLGALQAVQDAGRLQKTKYLAAVSGGSYIAAAFSLVAKTYDVPGDPPTDDSDPDLVTEKRPPFYEGSPEEQYLRNRLSYLAPSGLGKLLLVWRIACGLIINLLLVASVLALGAAILALYYRHAHPGLMADAPAASPNHVFVAIAWGLAALGLIAGLATVLLRPNHETARQALEMWSLYFVAVGLLGIAIELVLPEVIEFVQRHGDGQQAGFSGRPATVFGGGVGVSVASILAAVLLQVRAHTSDPKDAIKAAKDAAGWVKKLTPRLRLIVVNLATSVAGPLLLVGASVAAIIAQVDPPSDTWLWAFPAVAGGVFVLLYFVVGDLTSWSMHPYYRRRLCTAFALKRVRQPGAGGRGVAVERSQGQLVPLSETGVTPREPWWKSREWPTLIVCAAANVSDPGATPPGRGVTSFTFSPIAMGGPLVGGIGTAYFKEKLPKRRWRDFTLPAAVAMSGAAVSPSMGKLTRPRLRFLMALANVRLGVWVPNPRRLDSFVTTRRTWCNDVAEGNTAKVKAAFTPTARMSDDERAAVRKQADSKPLFIPRPRPRYLLKELLGQNSINDKYLYVTDGGHYDNVGLVELLRRGCMKIYCFDASGSGGMTNLGDAIALARSELGVEIEFSDGAIETLREDEKTELAGKACAVGKIRYTWNAPDQVGTLVYAPSVMTAELPWDVHAYKHVDRAFPHHSTMDQLFTDQKFEAYRVLGRHAAIEAMKAMDGAGNAAPQPDSPAEPSHSGGGAAWPAAGESLEEFAHRVAAFLRAFGR